MSANKKNESNGNLTLIIVLTIFGGISLGHFILCASSEVKHPSFESIGIYSLWGIFVFSGVSLSYLRKEIEFTLALSLLLLTVFAPQSDIWGLLFTTLGTLAYFFGVGVLSVKDKFFKQKKD